MNQHHDAEHATHDHDAHAHHGHDHHDDHLHVTPFWPMFSVLVVLLILTGLTLVTAKGMYFGNAINLTIALIIAGTKGLLVAGFFMHLFYDKMINTIVAVGTMFAVLLFFVLTLVDMGTRAVHDKTESGEIVPGGSVQISVDPETGRRTVSRGVFASPYSDTPGQSVVDIARAAGEHNKNKDGHGDDAGH